jgi:HSP20 family protein
MRNALAPVTGARWLRNEMDRLFDRVWDGDEFVTLGEWAPRVDLTDSPEMLTARIEIPGIDPKDIQVTLVHDLLTIKGEKRAEDDRKGEKILRVERAYGSFERSIKLPMPVDAQKVNATFKNGLLVIEMPKVPELKGMNIPIKVA